LVAAESPPPNTQNKSSRRREREREREREITTSHVPKTRFPEYICFSDLIPLKRILCNSFNLQNNQHPKKQNPKKVSDTSEASGFSTKDL
jgi:hypothetical protein